ncbi:hypothetical protein [Isoalcanivorax beigongshangi]|uniref:DUF2842 domain-containing protein n=1 Tax=Isoalcanivorax beigongshangi TaxID=3238810 RepID=A0ABV4AEA4_9GAMM
MKTTQSMTATLDRALAPIARMPLLYRALGLLVTVAAYLGGLALVQAASGDARMPMVLFGVFFLPAVLRAWLMLYWVVRKDPRAVGSDHEKLI